MDPTDRQAKSFADPVTARAGAVVSLALAAGSLFLGVRALVTGCVGLMRGRHGPSVVHCAPETSYWVATALSFLLGIVLIAIGRKLLRLGCSSRSPKAARR